MISIYYGSIVSLKRKVNVRYGNRMIHTYIYDIKNVSAGVPDENCDHGTFKDFHPSMSDRIAI